MYILFIYVLIIDIYIYMFFSRLKFASHHLIAIIYIYNLYTNIYIYMYQLFIDIYIYIHALHGFQSNYTVTVAEFQSPSGTSFRGG